MNQLITSYIPSQAGFRKGRNCLEQIHILRRILGAYHQCHLPLLATLVDFSKAFDSVNTNALFKILRHYGIPCKITAAITAMYTNCSSQLCLGNHFSKAFSITKGVLQGNTLAPFLFIIVVDYILQQTDDSLGLNPSLGGGHFAAFSNILLETFLSSLVSLPHPSLQIWGKTQTLVFPISGLLVNLLKTKIVITPEPVISKPNLEIQGSVRNWSKRTLF